MLSAQSVQNPSLLPANNPVEATIMNEPSAFWLEFSDKIIVAISDEHDSAKRSEIMASGYQLLSKHTKDVFASKAAYSLAILLYKDGEFESARKYFEWSLFAQESHPGLRLSARHMVAECFKAEGKYQEAIKASEAISIEKGPDELKSLLSKAALERKADLIAITDDGLTLKNRGAIESNYAAAALISSAHSKLSIDAEANALRSRIENLREMGEADKAIAVGIEFIKSYPDSYYAPIVAMEICFAEKSVLRSENIKKWLAFFQKDNHVSDNAGIANLKYALVNALIYESKYVEALGVGEVLINYVATPQDPIPWGEAAVSSVVNSLVLCAEQIGDVGLVDKYKKMLLSRYSTSAEAVMMLADNKRDSKHRGYGVVIAVSISLIGILALIKLISIKYRGAFAAADKR